MGLTREQYAYLMNPLKTTRVAKRSQGGKQLSYLEAWDVKAHLTRIFGFTNWDSEMLESNLVGVRDYVNNGKDMIEVAYKATIRLTIRDAEGNQLCRHTESAVGGASGPASSMADLHDNALKTAASDALKRCAINLGTQFGLSLYDDGNTADIVKVTLVKPNGAASAVPMDEKEEPTEEQEKIIEHVLGGSRVTETEGATA